ncbi:unnamed protein product [Microthlaspi erraticum]|uniref:VQ domain-containing protein n=1 Tax=Microthlaspi erraticum TaxID=1685480 RepID=A0A6D2HN51_9BRAS|nr:unnamed protein product [Microthlaspi erraticum]
MRTHTSSKENNIKKRRSERSMAPLKDSSRFKHTCHPSWRYARRRIAQSLQRQSNSSNFQSNSENALSFMEDQRNRVNDYPNNNDNHHHHHLGVNKMGKNIRKEPSNQQNQQQNPQPLVYNINKTDFRSIVQQLTGLGSTSSANPSQSTNPNPHKPPNSRLVKVRPAPLTQVNRPPPQPPVQSDPIASAPVHSVNQFSVNPAESPISAYMRYLIESSPAGNRSQPQNQNLVQPSTGLFPSHQTGPSSMLFQSPASQFLMSPQPRSPFPLLSPNFRVFTESLPPPSPSFFFPLFSPLWKNQ